jgi:hypothetical protein
VRVVPEEEGIVKIKQRAEYHRLVAKYGAGRVIVRAVDYRHAQPALFLRRIDPGFQPYPDCIIVVDAGKEGFVYQLDAKLTVVFRLPIHEFERGMKQLDAGTGTRFYRALK